MLPIVITAAVLLMLVFLLWNYLSRRKNEKPGHYQSPSTQGYSIMTSVFLALIALGLLYLIWDPEWRAFVFERIGKFTGG